MKIFFAFRIVMSIATIIFSLSSTTTAEASDSLLLKKGSLEINLSLKEILDKRSKTIITSTPWTTKTAFEGIRLSDLMHFLSANKGKLRLEALDGYWVTIPYTDIEKYNIILAYKANGKFLSKRNFGPFFIIYPYDKMENELNKPMYHSRSIWQVYKIEVEDENL